MIRRAAAPVVRSSKVAATSVGLVSTLIVFFFLGCASSSTGRLLNGGVIGAATADYVSTRYGISHGAHEGNALVGDGAWRQALVKVFGASAVIGLASLSEKQHPVLANIIRSAAIVTWTSISIRNVVVTR
jgi:hypothetical protein